VAVDFTYLQKINPTHVKKGTKTVLEIQIHNDKPFIFPYIKVFYQTPYSAIKKQEKEFVCSVFPFQHKAIQEEINCDLRGRFHIGIVRVEIRDIFGLFTFSVNLTNKTYHKPLILEVWPRILTLPHLPISLMEQGSNINLNFVATNELSNPSDTRSYRPGDALKRIHWKLSSKLLDIQVKNFETGTRPENLLFIETIPFSSDDLTRYKVEDQVVECSIAIIHHILSKWYSIELICYDTSRQNLIGNNPHDFERFYNYIGSLQFNSIFPMEAILKMEYPQIHRGSSIIIIIHHLSHELFNMLYQFRQSGVFVMVLYIDPSQHIKQDIKEMLEGLNEKDIPTIIIHPDQRLDKILEAWL